MTPSFPSTPTDQTSLPQETQMDNQPEKASDHSVTAPLATTATEVATDTNPEITMSSQSDEETILLKKDLKKDANLEEETHEQEDDQLGEADLEEDIEDDDELLAADINGEVTATPEIESVDVNHTVQADQAGQRIDKLASVVFTDFSRAQLAGWINDGKLLVDGVSQKPKYRVKTGQKLTLQVQLEQHGEDLPENIPLDVIYEDDTVIVINKPVGMVVHPGAGNWSGTLVNALLYHYPNQRHLPRAGLVHRIDKDTSGLLLIAKTKPAQLHLTEQLKDKTVYRHYQCVVAGSLVNLKRHRHIDAPIGRHSTMRTKMAVHSKGRDAITHLVNITPLNDNYSLLDVNLETGRTHQIRVHLSHIGYPLVGDKVYGGRRQLRAGLTEAQRQAINNFPRQALHAYSLGFVHPVTGEDVEVTAPLPDDMLDLIAVLSEKSEPQAYDPLA